MTLTKRTVVEKVQCRYRLPSGSPDGTAFDGGVLFDDAAEKIQFSLETDVEPARVHVRGDQTALRAFGEYLVALSRYGGYDPAYHDHFDDAALIVHGPPSDGQITRVTEETADVAVTFLDDSRSGTFDASGVGAPAREENLVAAAIVDEGEVQFHLGGTRGALAELGAYLIGLSFITTPGYEDVLYAPGRFADADPVQLVFHAPASGS